MRAKPSRASTLGHNKLGDFSSWGDPRDNAAIAVEVAVPDVAIRSIGHDQHLAGRMQRERAKLPPTNVEASDLVPADIREPEVAVLSFQEKCRPRSLRKLEYFELEEPWIALRRQNFAGAERRGRLCGGHSGGKRDDSRRDQHCNVSHKIAPFVTSLFPR
jgi:hypothetical protein